MKLPPNVPMLERLLGWPAVWEQLAGHCMKGNMTRSLSLRSP